MLIFIIVNLYRKNTTYETWINELDQSLKKVLNDWKAIDSRQMFEKDDEVGVVYEGIEDIINEIEIRTSNND